MPTALSWRAAAAGAAAAARRSGNQTVVPQEAMEASNLAHEAAIAVHCHHGPRGGPRVLPSSDAKEFFRLRVALLSRHHGPTACAPPEHTMLKSSPFTVEIITPPPSPPPFVDDAGYGSDDSDSNSYPPTLGSDDEATSDSDTLGGDSSSYAVSASESVRA